MIHKDEIEYLENELRSYRKIVDMYYKYEQMLEDAKLAKLGNSSPCFKEVMYENIGDPYKCKYTGIDEEINEAIKGLNIWHPRKQWIEERLSILNETEYKIIKYRYMMTTKATYDWIASVIPCCKNTVINTIEKTLDKMLKIS